MVSYNQTENKGDIKMTRYNLWLYDDKHNEKRLEVYNTFEQAERRGKWCVESTNVHFHYDRYEIIVAVIKL